MIFNKSKEVTAEERIAVALEAIARHIGAMPKIMAEPPEKAWLDYIDDAAEVVEELKKSELESLWQA